jgi:hypothetical protein
LLPEPHVLRFEFLIATFQRPSLALPLLKFLSNLASIPIDRFPTLLGFPGVATDGPLLHETTAALTQRCGSKVKFINRPSLVRTEKGEVLHYLGFWVNTNRDLDQRSGRRLASAIL